MYSIFFCWGVNGKCLYFQSVLAKDKKYPKINKSEKQKKTEVSRPEVTNETFFLSGVWATVSVTTPTRSWRTGLSRDHFKLGPILHQNKAARRVGIGRLERGHLRIIADIHQVLRVRAPALFPSCWALFGDLLPSHSCKAGSWSLLGRLVFNNILTLLWNEIQDCFEKKKKKNKGVPRLHVKCFQDSQLSTNVRGLWESKPIRSIGGWWNRQIHLGSFVSYEISANQLQKVLR